jgi:hypothetical protein
MDLREKRPRKFLPTAHFIPNAPAIISQSACCVSSMKEGGRLSPGEIELARSMDCFSPLLVKIQPHDDTARGQRQICKRGYLAWYPGDRSIPARSEGMNIRGNHFVELAGDGDGLVVGRLAIEDGAGRDWSFGADDFLLLSRQGRGTDHPVKNSRAGLSICVKTHR